MLSLFLLFVTLQDQAIISKEPVPASPWLQIIEAECEGRHIRIEGYGARRPAGTQSKILLDGRTATDPALQPFLNDLSRQGVMYRFQMLCETGITVRMSYAEEQLSGNIRYRGGTAFFDNGQFKLYTGLEELNEESFWFD